jgi:hypothetical protein
MCLLQFGCVIFWQKDFGAKAAHKMLVKLTPGQQKLAADYLLQLLRVYSADCILSTNSFKTHRCQ